MGSPSFVLACQHTDLSCLKDQCSSPTSTAGILRFLVLEEERAKQVKTNPLLQPMEIEGVIPTAILKMGRTI